MHFFLEWTTVNFSYGFISVLKPLFICIWIKSILVTHCVHSTKFNCFKIAYRFLDWIITTPTKQKKWSWPCLKSAFFFFDSKMDEVHFLSVTDRKDFAGITQYESIYFVYPLKGITKFLCFSNKWCENQIYWLSIFSISIFMRYCLLLSSIFCRKLDSIGNKLRLWVI